MITGITRVRNEALIVEDTLTHFLSYCDRIYLYDDCSTDNTLEIARSFDRVIAIEGDQWRVNRNAEETRHRALLMSRAQRDGADWCLCFDADERLVGELPLLDHDAFRFRLFDAYLTPEHSEPYVDGPLDQLARGWGPEYRDIIMLFRARRALWNQTGQREPAIAGRVGACDVRVRHYGKCLSIEHWEDTCAYYATHFPAFRRKWSDRRGRAIHTQSDFDRPLYAWDELDRVQVPL